MLPPQQHLYLLYASHKDKNDKKPNAATGFEDFFDIDLLQTHHGFHVIQMKDFLVNEAVTGGLHNILPPKNSSKLWGRELWKYMVQVADQSPGKCHILYWYMVATSYIYLMVVLY